MDDENVSFRLLADKDPLFILLLSHPYLCWRRLSCRLKYLPQISHEYVTSGLLCVRSWIMRLYDFVKRLWQNLQMNSHFGRIFRRKSRQSSESIRITANILPTSMRLSQAHTQTRSSGRQVNLHTDYDAMRWWWEANHRNRARPQLMTVCWADKSWSVGGGGFLELVLLL